MKFQAIEANRDQVKVINACRILGVSRSGYYAWRDRKPSARKQCDANLTQQIKAIWYKSKRLYGSPKIHAELRDLGEKVSRKRVARLMREAQIEGKSARRKRTRTTQADDSHPVQPNRLNRDFKADRPNQKWLTDITYIETREGFLYVAGVMDLFGRKIVGLAMADHMRSELVESAFCMALTERRPDRGLLHHSDRGSQYTGHAYQDRLRETGAVSSMSRRGDCLDNAPMESFWATLKRECADHVFASRQAARNAIFSYVMGFYNRTRRHSALGYLSPAVYEQSFERHFLCA
jgi:transposase InsO family protein